MRDVIWQKNKYLAQGDERYITRYLIRRRNQDQLKISTHAKRNLAFISINIYKSHIKHKMVKLNKQEKTSVI